MPKMANLHRPLWAQIPNNLDEKIYGYDRIYEYFQAVFTISQ
jgi:hypothetical protein